MKTHKWKDIKNVGKSAARIEEIDRKAQAELIALDLRELRKLAGKTQEEVAVALETTQGEISRFEKREDRLLSSIRKYVEGLGGELEVVAVIGNKRLTLSGL